MDTIPIHPYPNNSTDEINETNEIGENNTEHISGNNNNGNNNSSHKNVQKWNILYTNIRGIKSKLTSLRQSLTENLPHLFLLTETQLRSNTGISAEGYTFFGRKREGKIGGGVGICVRNDIRPSIAAHISERNLEIIWVSIRRRKTPPLFVGTYYGKQETRTSKNEIEREMTLLNEEIEEIQKEGEILLTMDGNAKIGLLGEEISRNGKEILKVTGTSIS